ncbi:hypothetical protein J6590_082959 [Homalodisca vitripennis]|nr:hypothetical protein J6590_082959 [Homalodisca vitripennis]
MLRPAWTKEGGSVTPRCTSATCTEETIAEPQPGVVVVATGMNNRSLGDNPTSVLRGPVFIVYQVENTRTTWARTWQQGLRHPCLLNTS